MKKIKLPALDPNHGILTKETYIRMKSSLTNWLKIKHLFYDENRGEYFIQPTTGKYPYTQFNKFASNMFITDKNCPHKMRLREVYARR